MWKHSTPPTLPCPTWQQCHLSICLAAVSLGHMPCSCVTRSYASKSIQLSYLQCLGSTSTPICAPRLFWHVRAPVSEHPCMCVHQSVSILACACTSQSASWHVRAPVSQHPGKFQLYWGHCPDGLLVLSSARARIREGLIEAFAVSLRKCSFPRACPPSVYRHGSTRARPSAAPARLRGSDWVRHALCTAFVPCLCFRVQGLIACPTWRYWSQCFGCICI